MSITTEKARLSIVEAIRSLREKPSNSTLVERYFLLYEAWDMVEGLPQPLQMGEGLRYVLQRASLPIKEHDLLLGRYDDHVPTKAEQEKLKTLWEREPGQNPIVKNNRGHIVLDFEGLVNEGIVDKLHKAQKRLQLAVDRQEDQKAQVFLQGMIASYESILIYIARYGDAARAAGMEECAAVCNRLCERAPQTFREAMQLILFVYNIYLIYAGAEVACLNVGRLDDFLLPLYLQDIQSGALTEEEAGCLIDDFSAKMSLHLGRGEHQMAYLGSERVNTGWLRNPVYDSPGYVVLGGYSNYRDHKENPLTLLFARHIHPELKNPIYICRYTADYNEALWDILYEKVQKNASLVFYNDETVISAYMHIGVKEEDARNYSIFPCNWASLAGCMTVIGNLQKGKSLPVVLNEALASGKAFSNMDELYEEAKERYGHMVKQILERYRNACVRNKPKPNGILSLNDCFERGTMEQAHGIAEYPIVYVPLRNIGTAADMLSAIDTLVFKEKFCTLEELVQATEDDFEARPDILKRCKKAPKYGTNDPVADGHAVRLMTELLDVIDREATDENGVRNAYTLNVTINDSDHLRDGAQMNATVDGRRKGKPLSENLGPTVGYSKGVTSLLNSVAKLPFDRIHSGALNIRLRKNSASGEKGLNCIRALMRSYFQQGGMQLQVSVADTKELRKAQENPDEYRDLLVRITGYSAVFVDMCKEAQDEFIRREELQ